MSQQPIGTPIPQDWLRLPPPGHPFRQKVKDGLLALSLANLCFIPAWFSQLYDSDFGYFNNLPITLPTLLALLTNLAWLTSVVWLVLRAWRRFQNRIFHFMIHMGFFVLLLIPLQFVRSWITLPERISGLLLKHPSLMIAAIAAVALAFWQHRRLAKIAALGVGFMTPLAFFTVAKIVLLCLGVTHLRQADFEIEAPPLGPIREGQPRVVWMIFDEMDYRLAFERRPAKCQLPAFERLRNESLFATNAYPPGDTTSVSIPSLISGRRVSSAVLTNSSDMLLVLAATGKAIAWKELPSVFSSARELGVNTALVGWAIPYDRELGKDLNYCVWFPFPGFQPSRAATFGAAMLRQIACLAPPLHIMHDYVRLYLDSMTESLSVVTNAQYGLSLLHLHPPHDPAIYIPDKGRFRIWGTEKAESYFDQLILADRSLERLRRAMETSGEWDKTWIIISADHSWRKSKRYDGQRDLRVPFLIKTPGEARSVTFSPRLNTVVTRDLILAILRGEVRDQDSAMGWLDEHRRTEPTTTGGGPLHE